ncbi:hypothetical protein ZOSMA_18G00300 [Zostera marina]|uniref:C2H2-type domain-containing protein n=1 Tax=Zostera marina TaxID=29655 RepID=A0A0K9PPD8_ZOSMR|nr:hypothetical protein ZOSMA_18G00300 [Zostera marina]
MADEEMNRSILCRNMNQAGKKVYSCQYCDRRFHSSQALGGHQNGHKQERLDNRRAQKDLEGQLPEQAFYNYPYYSSSSYRYQPYQPSYRFNFVRPSNFFSGPSSLLAAHTPFASALRSDRQLPLPLPLPSWMANNRNMEGNVNVNANLNGIAAENVAANGAGNGVGNGEDEQVDDGGLDLTLRL